jgi:hypothetical protein
MSKKGQKTRSRKKKPTTAASVEPPVVEAVAPVSPEPAVELSSPSALTPPRASPPVASLETPIAFEAPRVVELTSEPSANSNADASIPPVDLDSHFFESASRHEALDDGIEEPEERDPRIVLKLAPATARRRAQLQRYVRFAVGAASVLCLAALVKVAVAHNHEEPTVRRAPATTQVAPQPVEAMQPATPAPPPAEPEIAPAAAAAVASAAPTEPVAEATPISPAPSAVPAATDIATAAAADPEVPAEPDPKAAAKEKHASQLALERGKVADAIEAGERSVALDPSDAEAWLILGAAYQEKGDAKNSRRSFKACLEQGKRGPKWECAQFPH